ncbi:MAG: Gfo/Idh/MocA family oxidoreductase [Oscillospiraceae bacterium]|nr:Gfo/Idh/MocA family oxidoreductase [Oscillospiraceae bacterium]
MEKVRLGIIGIGNMGSSHAKKVVEGKCPDFVLTAIADTNTERHTWVKETLGENIVCFDNAIAMLDSGLIDACIVAVPHYDHCTLAMECMRRNIHVLVEKPAGVYTKQVREMNAEADKHPDVVFAMMFNQRTNHIYRKLKELIASGEYGQIRRTNWIITNWYRPQAYYDSGAWRATWAGEGGGVLLNQCPHQLDLWQWLCGMPVKVHGHLLYGKWHDIEVEDDVTAYVEYANGATGVFITTTGDGCGSNRLEIQLDKAKIIAEKDKLEVWEFEVSEPEFNRTNTKSFGKIEAHEIEVETDGENPQHVGVINAFGGAILRGEPLVADGREGINGLTLSNAMHLSSWTGKTVELPLDEDLYYEELMKRVATSRRKENVKSVVADTESSYGTAPTGEDKKSWNTNW